MGYGETMRTFRQRGPAERSLLAGCLLSLLFGAQRTAQAYIDPGTGQQLWTALGPLLAVLLVSLTFIVLPLRWTWRMARSLREKSPRWARVVAVVVGLASLIAGSITVGMQMAGSGTAIKVRGAHRKAVQMRFKRVLVVGMDGLDPKLLGAMMEAGDLPNFAKLKAEGTFSPLRTTSPPESPVAWLSAATGCNPGQTGVFDFIRRRPQSYLPELTLPRTKRRSALSRTGSAFVPASDQRAVWDILSEHGIPASVIRWPVTFPPTQTSGRMLSGLGTPDVCGTLGRYRFFTTAKIAPDDRAPERVSEVRWDGNRISTELPGPEVLSLGGTKTSVVPLVIERNDSKDAVTISLGKDVLVHMKVGAWSGWQSVSFPGGLSRSCPAMVKMYVTSITPELGLYVSALHIDPSNAAFPISTPKEFSKDLAGRIGLYATLGMPEDGQAVQHGRIPLSAFLELCNEITDEREKMLELELKRLREGALFFVFDTSDRIQHMFWAATDCSHPAHTAELAKQYGDVIRAHYRRMDKVIGKALDAAKDGQTAIFVLSDHGFTSFSRAVHLNTWLVNNGFMSLREGEKEGVPLLKSVDWSKTKAYAVGFCSLYINMEGREGNGSVSPDEYQSVREKLARDLKLWSDPATGDPVMRNVYLREDIYRGECLNDAPDLIVGYYPGYRASWQTALGGAPEGESVTVNDELWAGDHLVDAPCVPGIFLSNVRYEPSNPCLTDLAPTILRCFGLEPTPEMDGKPL